MYYLSIFIYYFTLKVKIDAGFINHDDEKLVIIWPITEVTVVLDESFKQQAKYNGNVAISGSHTCIFIWF